MTTEEILEKFADQWHLGYKILKAHMKDPLIENDVKGLMIQMDIAWDKMKLLIPQSHYDEINKIVYGIIRKG